MASLFMGYDDNELSTGTTNMRTLLDYELNASMEMQEGAAWDTDYVQDIFIRQGKLNIACQSEHVKAVTQKVTLFFEGLADHLSDANLATVCGIHNFTPYKIPSVECIRNYGETGMRQLELTNSAPADIDMSLLQKLIPTKNLQHSQAQHNQPPSIEPPKRPITLEAGSQSNSTNPAQHQPPFGRNTLHPSKLQKRYSATRQPYPVSQQPS